MEAVCALCEWRLFWGDGFLRHEVTWTVTNPIIPLPYTYLFANTKTATAQVAVFCLARFLIRMRSRQARNTPYCTV